MYVWCLPSYLSHISYRFHLFVYTFATCYAMPGYVHAACTYIHYVYSIRLTTGTHPRWLIELTLFGRLASGAVSARLSYSQVICCWWWINVDMMGLSDRMFAGDRWCWWIHCITYMLSSWNCVTFLFCSIDSVRSELKAFEKVFSLWLASEEERLFFTSDAFRGYLIVILCLKCYSVALFVR